MKQATLNQRRDRAGSPAALLPGCNASIWRLPTSKFTLACILAVLGAVILFLSGCGTANSHAPTDSFDTVSDCSYTNNLGVVLPCKQVTHLRHRALVTNYYAGVLDMMDSSMNRLTAYTFPVGAQPTYMQPSPTASLTLVNNTGSGTLSSFDNFGEFIRGTAHLGGATESFATTTDDNFGFAAVPTYSNGNYATPGAIVRFSPMDGSVNTADVIEFPNVQYLSLDALQTHLLAFEGVSGLSTNLCGNTVSNSDIAYWVDLSATDPVTHVPPYYPLCLTSSGGAVQLSRPIKAFFTPDKTRAYILSCGAECGGSGGASVTELDITAGSIAPPATPATGTPIPASVIRQVPVNGARVGLFDATANKLYVAGSMTTSTANDCAYDIERYYGGCAPAGAHNVQDGWFTVLDLPSFTVEPPNSEPPLTVEAPIQIGNGVKYLIRNIKGVFWVGSLNCGVQSCVTLVDPTLTNPDVTTPVENTPVVLTGAKMLSTGPTNGNATGISLQVVTNSSTDDVYTIEGGELFIYDQKGNPVTSEFPTDIKGQAWDVLFIN